MTLVISSWGSQHQLWIPQSLDVVELSGSRGGDARRKPGPPGTGSRSARDSLGPGRRSQLSWHRNAKRIARPFHSVLPFSSPDSYFWYLISLSPVSQIMSAGAQDMQLRQETAPEADTCQLVRYRTQH